MTKPFLTPGPDHPITIVKHPRRVVVSFGGEIIADTREALSLREASYPVVFYVPRKDTKMTLLHRTEHTSHCPYKGEAAYFTIAAGDRQSTNAVWTYERPHAAVAEIAGCLAFYADRVDEIEERA